MHAEEDLLVLQSTDESYAGYRNLRARMRSVRSCAKCGRACSSQPLELGNYHNKPWCRKCKRDFQRKYAKFRRDESAQGSSYGGRLARYGLTSTDYDELLAFQGGRCAGCGRHPRPNRRLDVDHRHQPGDRKRQPWERAIEVRGLLCHLCNRALGIVRDNARTLRALAAYLENPPAAQVVLPRVVQIIESLDARK